MQPKLSQEQQSFLVYVDGTFRGQSFGYVARRSGGRMLEDYDAWQQTLLLISNKLLSGEWSTNEEDSKVAKFCVATYQWNVWHHRHEPDHIQARGGDSDEGSGPWEFDDIRWREDTSTTIGNRSSRMFRAMISEIQAMREDGIKAVLVEFIKLYQERPFEPGTRHVEFYKELLRRYVLSTGSSLKNVNSIRAKFVHGRKRLWQGLIRRGVVSGDRPAMNSNGDVKQENQNRKGVQFSERRALPQTMTQPV